MSKDNVDVTQRLQAWQQGDAAAGEELFQMVYAELKHIAARQMRNERPDHTLQATALVNEAYGRLVAQRATWKNRRHFYGIAAEIMSRILTDHAKRINRQKRGGGAVKVDLDELYLTVSIDIAQQTELGELQENLKIDDPQAYEIFMLSHYAGLENAQIAELKETSVSTVSRNLRYAKSWLKRALNQRLGDGTPTGL
jgi:RNA polymerase sigma factor (TIGR02999 family)